jgi:S1-C subfamily serine protease
LNGSADLVRKIGALAPGADVELRILRNGQKETVSVTLGNAPGKQQVSELGLSLAPANSVAEPDCRE